MKKEEAEDEDEKIRELQRMKDELLEDMFENTEVERNIKNYWFIHTKMV